MVIEAKYEDGVFKPLGKVKIEEGTVVEIHLGEKAPTVKSLSWPEYRTTNQWVARSIGDLGFAGMWADRTDFKDGVTFVNSLRDNPRA
jgi:predicted DNA-binding antitoxin AbrB/MazE fold protein